MQKDPFKISIPDETLKDLHLRLTRTRWPIDFTNSNWEYGTNGTYLKELVDYWLQWKNPSDLLKISELFFDRCDEFLFRRKNDECAHQSL